MGNNRGPIVVGLGEALFDVFPDRVVLGGAPLNAAVHAHQLFRPLGGAGVVASRVGNDEHGRRLESALNQRRMDSRYLQLDPDRPTGQVLISLDDGEPSYDIRRKSAWDAIQFDHRWSELAQSCHAVCFGTLAQRSALSREAVRRFLSTATAAFKLFDVNLRQTYYSQGIIEESLRLADAAKFNDSELAELAQLLDLGIDDDGTDPESLHDRQCVEIQSRFELRWVARTRGAAGTVLYADGTRHAQESVEYPGQPDANAVGAGDACSAGLLAGTLLEWPADRILHLANHLGAFVASVHGATPQLPEHLIATVK